MHPPPSSIAQNSTTLYQTITNTLGRTSSRSNSGSSTLSNMSTPSSRSPPQSSHKRTSSQHKSSSAANYTNSSLPRNLVFDYVQPEEVRAAHALEVEGYPPEDAASYEKLLSRQKAAPHLFIGAFVPMPPPKVAGPLTGPLRRKLVGFITGTAATALTLRSMSTHDDSSDAHMVCIHSVCVSPEFQRKGLATRMLENYIARIRRAEEGKGPEGEKGKRGYETLALLAHEELTGLYKKVGFRTQCVSHIQYGSGQWLEMRRSVYPSPASGLTRTTSATSSTSEDAPAALKMTTNAPPASTTVTSPSAYSPTSAASTQPPSEAKSAPKPALSPISTPASPPGMPSQASIMAALAAQFQPGKSPGQTYTSILGQAVAAKTPAEDAGLALEARLVDRETNTNLAKLYCPQENCRCLILGKGAGEWTRKESGPLSNPDMDLPNSPTPPQGPAFPVRVGAEGGKNKLLTSVKGFWVVEGALGFDNVGFSRDMKWTVPNDPTSPGGPSGTNSMSSSFEFSGQRTKQQEKELKEQRKREEKERQKEEKERKKREKREAKRGGSGSDSNNSDEDVSTLLAHLSLGLTPGEELTVKYLLCPDCECGPLGFTILPTEMQGGRLAAEVGDQVERLKGGTMGMPGAAPKRPPQLFYLAADRVRYLFERTN